MLIPRVKSQFRKHIWQSLTCPDPYVDGAGCENGQRWRRGGGAAEGERGLLAMLPCFAQLKWLMGIVRIKIAVEEKQTKITRDS